MRTSRRAFLRHAAAGATGVLAAGSWVPRAAGASGEVAQLSVEPTRTPLRILILGGTGFTGPFQVRYALARGHTVTVFNRGRRNPGLFGGAVEELIGDRNDDLEALKGRTWDVVIDNPTTLPVWVRDAARILQGNVDRYVFISTLSVLGDTSRPGLDETAALAEYQGADPYAETMGTLMANVGGLYGPLKALSEQEAERWFPGRALVIRPGLIVGPEDGTDRFTYWPLRVARGGEVLAPGDPTDPVQFIDGRDIAEWTIRMVEQGDVGVYNTVGPQAPLSMAEMLYGMRAVVSNDIRFTWVDAEFLDAHGVRPWADMPVWLPQRDTMAGFARISNARAVSRGLTFRPLATTVSETLAWWDTLDPERRGRPLQAGLSPEREGEVLAAWRERS